MNESTEIEHSGPNSVTKDDVMGRVRTTIDRYRKVSQALSVSGCSRTSLRRYRTGESMPPFDVAARLAAGAGVSLHWLATGQGAMLTDAAHQRQNPAPERPGDGADAAPPPTTGIDFLLLANIVKALVSSLPAATIAQMPATALAQRLTLMYRALIGED